ncbi:MAG: hypothetical protein IKM31_11175 [Oscillospiraceae bacterium]|nr:hypothetical protein [Oscillospiraceae bacterium]
MERVIAAAALLCGKETDDICLRLCAAEAVEEVLRFCGLCELPEGCVSIAARRAAVLCEGGRDVKAKKLGDLSVSCGDGEESFRRSLIPYRKVRF